MSTRPSIRLAGLVLAAIFMSTGCTTVLPTKEEPAEPLVQRRPKLYRTQAGDQVTLQWESTAGIFYSVVT